MPCELPDPYPDELLYSVLARYGIWTGISSARDLLLRCFGINSIVATYDMPCHIDKLISSLPASYGYKAEDIVKNYTMFPFYTAFMTQDRRDQLLQQMLSGPGGGIHMSAGVTAAAVKVRPYFRYCGLCAEDSMRIHGEMYWRRLHQTPGVEACAIHGIALKDSLVPVHGHYRELFVSAEPQNCPITDSATVAHPFFSDLSRDIDRLYQLDTPLNFEMTRATLTKTLQARGYVSGIGHLRLKRINELIRNEIPDVLIEQLFKNIGMNGLIDRLIVLLRGQRSISHPLYHLLLIRILYGGLEIFLTLLEKPATHFKCFNAASEHYGKEVVESIELKRGKRKREFWHARCDCGYAYSSADRFPEQGGIRTIEYGPIWEDKLRELSAKGYSIRHIARELKADSKTIHTHLGRSPTTDRTEENVNDSVKHFEARSRWLSLLDQHPELDAKRLRERASGLYAWLYRHDRKWLTEHIPKIKKAPVHNERVNWDERDVDTLLRLKSAYQELLRNEEMMVRITKNRLMTTAKVKYLLEHHTDKLPQCNTFIRSVGETVEQYRIRRAPWAVRNVIAEDPDMPMWKIYRMLGVRSKPSLLLIKTVESLMRSDKRGSHGKNTENHGLAFQEK